VGWTSGKEREEKKNAQYTTSKIEHTVERVSWAVCARKKGSAKARMNSKWEEWACTKWGGGKKAEWGPVRKAMYGAGSEGKGG